MTKRLRLAVVVSHPIQYYAPLYARLARHEDLELKVFFTWHDGTRAMPDPGFGESFQWDIPLTEGYSYELVPNSARDPGMHHFFGLKNPDLLKRILAWTPDVVHLTGWAWRSHLIALRELARRRIPVLFRGDSHLLDDRRAGARWAVKKSVLQNVYRWPALFLATGAANREYYKSFGVDQARIVDCPHSVDVQRFAHPAVDFERQATEWRRQLEISDDQIVVLFAGKFEQRKRPMELMRAIESAHTSNVVGVFAGNGPQLPQIREIASHAGKRFRVLPFQNQSRMPILYRLGDLFVLPSSHGETWGLAVNEALACGRPVLISDRVGCAPDVVAPECGKVFRAGDHHDLTQALVEMTSNRERLMEMRQAAASRSWAFDLSVTESALQKTLRAGAWR